jgi:hypothetical protein
MDCVPFILYPCPCCFCLQAQRGSTRRVCTVSMASNGAVSQGDERLSKLREQMAKADGGKGVAAYIVPTEDPHMSEYPPDHFKRREYITRCRQRKSSMCSKPPQGRLCQILHSNLLIPRPPKQSVVEA